MLYNDMTVTESYTSGMILAAFGFTETGRDDNTSIQITFLMISIDFRAPILKYCGGKRQMVSHVCLHNLEKIVENALLLQFVTFPIVLKSLFTSPKA